MNASLNLPGTAGTKGRWRAHAALHEMPGPITLPYKLPALRPGYRAQYVLQNKTDGQAVPNFPYRIKTASGRVIAGLSNGDGETLELFSATAEDVTLDVPQPD